MLLFYHLFFFLAILSIFSSLAIMLNILLQVVMFWSEFEISAASQLNSHTHTHARTHTTHTHTCTHTHIHTHIHTYTHTHI